MNPEVLMKKGQLAMAEHEAAEQAIRIAGLKREIRIYLAEHGDPEDFEATRVMQLTEQLVKVVQTYDAALEAIARLREELNMPRYERRSDRRRP